jgi:hypothetical protein
MIIPRGWKLALRILVACCGGCLLLIPLQLVIDIEDEGLQLVVIGSFTIALAFGLSLGTKASYPELLGATAAYAAVLAVFVKQNQIVNA